MAQDPTEGSHVAQKVSRSRDPISPEDRRSFRQHFSQEAFSRHRICRDPIYQEERRSFRQHFSQEAFYTGVASK